MRNHVIRHARRALVLGTVVGGTYGLSRLMGANHSSSLYRAGIGAVATQTAATSLAYRQDEQAQLRQAARNRRAHQDSMWRWQWEQERKSGIAAPPPRLSPYVSSYNPTRVIGRYASHRFLGVDPKWAGASAVLGGLANKSNNVLARRDHADYQARTMRRYKRLRAKWNAEVA